MYVKCFKMADSLNSDQIIEKFCFDLDELVGDNYLSTLIGGGVGESKFHFNNRIVSNCAFDARFLPNPIPYLKHMGVEATNEDIRLYTRTICSKKFIDYFHDCFINRDLTDDEFMDDFMVNHFIPDENALEFFCLLYFFIFSIRVTCVPMLVSEGTSAWRVENDYEKMSSFGAIVSEKRMLFHGTPANCVYSILRNGLKGLSGSKYMTTGAIYGDGIYCSDDISLASSYARTAHTHDGRRTSSYLLVLMVKNASERQRHYFVQKDEEVLVCGIIEYNGSIGYGDEHAIGAIQTQGRIVYNATDVTPFEPREVSQKVVSIERLRIEEETKEELEPLHFDMHDSPQNSSKVVKTGRFVKEVNRLFLRKFLDNKAFSEQENSLIRRMNFNEPGNMCSPLLVEIVPPNDTPLYADLQRQGIPGIVIGFHFGDEYPYVPFEVRIVYPRIKEGTGRVTSGGSICMDVLYAGQGWSPSNTIFGIIMNIITIIPNEGQRGDESESRGRLAEHNCKRTYSYAEYKRGYQIAKDFHKW